MSGNLARAPASPAWQFAIQGAKRRAAEPLLDILGPEWMLEREALEGLNYPETRLLFAIALGLAERRRRGPPWRREWHIRLTRKGWAEA